MSELLVRSDVLWQFSTDSPYRPATPSEIAAAILAIYETRPASRLERTFVTNAMQRIIADHTALTNTGAPDETE